MSAAVQPFIDTAISKTVNVPADYPFDGVQGPLLRGLEGRTQGHRDLSPERACWARCSKCARGRARRRTAGPRPADPTAASASIARCSRRSPACAGRAGRSSPTAIRAGRTSCAIRWATSPCSSATSTTAQSYPFEVWINGAEQPRGLGAIAKTLSMDMRTNDRAWLDMKLSALQKAGGDDGFEMAMPPDGAQGARAEPRVGLRASSSAIAATSSARSPTTRTGKTPVVDALMGPKEPKAGPDGTLSLDRRRDQPRDRRRLRAVPERAGDARRAAPALLDVAVRRVSARARRPVQGAVARHARATIPRGSA